MNREHLIPSLQRLAHKIAPGSTMLRAWDLPGGMSAALTVFEVELKQGERRKLILRTRELAGLSVEDEFRTLGILQRLGIAAPAPVLVDVSTELFPRPYLVLEYVEGEVDFAPADPVSAARQMARLLASLHTSDLTGLELACLPANSAGLEVEASGTPYGLSGLMHEGLIRAVLASMPAPTWQRTVLLHGDFWPGNILWQADELAAVLDWEDASLGDPLADLAIARLDLTCIFSQEAAQSFTREYLQLTGFDAAALPYWDLCAALRLIRLTCCDLTGWTEFFAAHGRQDITTEKFLAAFQEFTEQAVIAPNTARY